MKILEGEIALRDDTRVAEQARSALAEEEFHERAEKLAERQGSLKQRSKDLAVRIEKLPEGAQLFAKEIGLLTAVARVMDDAASVLAQPDTGAPAIAAETEAIEMLLASKRINPSGGGGGGSTPGGGGGGTTSDAALALVGKGVNPREKRKTRVVADATGQTESTLPEEFRDGLDQYFNRMSESTQ